MADETKQPKKKVYVETSVIGYLVARPSRDVIKNAWQVATNQEADYLEELWKVKEELSSCFSSFRKFFNDMLKWQHDEEANGRDYVQMPIAHAVSTMA